MKAIPSIFEFDSKRLTLLEVTNDDLDDVHQLLSIPEVDEFNTFGIPNSLEDTEKHINQIIKHQSKVPRDSYTWKIILKSSNQFIGLTGFVLSNDKYKLGEIYYKFHPKYWGNGFATELSKRLVILGFEEFNLHKVEAGVATENIKSIRVLEKIGMIREGLRRKILPIRGEWKDNYHYAIVEDDKRDY